MKLKNIGYGFVVAAAALAFVLGAAGSSEAAKMKKAKKAARAAAYGVLPDDRGGAGLRHARRHEADLRELMLREQ